MGLGNVIVKIGLIVIIFLYGSAFIKTAYMFCEAMAIMLSDDFFFISK